jgi:NAD(P)-dependent dehydrogenase (short-subunit alcohol dehydrogenase family)
MLSAMDLTGKSCIVTGATSGIGEVTAMTLAAAGARLGILCRDPAKGERTLQQIRRETGNDAVQLFRADLASQAEVRTVAAEILASFPQIHLLINNAGVVNLKFSETVDGIETTFAVNHLAYFLLTQLLLDRVRASAPARIVNVASDAHKFVGAFNFDDPQSRSQYKSMRVYGYSKLANILFTRELARRLEGTDVTVNAVHPGAVATGLGTNNGRISKALTSVLGIFFKNPEQGAATSLHVAMSPELEGVSGQYFAKSREAKISSGARDDAAAARLWTLSEEMTGLAPPA